MSAVRETGTVTTNDPHVNKPAGNIRWGRRGNYLRVPTDCPQRDERLGWTGDTQVFAVTGLCNADAFTFLSHLQDTVVDSQTIYGADGAQYTGVAPGGRYNFPGGGSGWADCGVVLPWIRRQTGDTYAGQGSLTGDRLAPQETSAQLMSDAYYGYSAHLMARMARAIGRAEEAETYERLFGRIRQAFIARYLSTEGGRVAVRSGRGDASPIEPGSEPNEKTEDNSQSAPLWVLKLGLRERGAAPRPGRAPGGRHRQRRGPQGGAPGQCPRPVPREHAVRRVPRRQFKRVPAVSADSVREGGTPLADVAGVRFLGHAEGVSSCLLPSGPYRLTADLR
ncbi:bacterial alpha-L-rhamnosidase [Streptomyces scabiei]|uniref:alpha-L-rhamnosidase n=1 Tax=Streptomyces scabiei TaxID=1930 RepID=A0A100JJB4_STRSC|nr:bacterial alpha-L-rhamnosidase [Streptomyces scabiei]